jgi:HK97 family phage major capsid protein
MAYDTLIERDAAPNADPLVPEPIVGQIIAELPKASVVSARARTIPLSAKVNRVPVMDVLPLAYWVSGDTGLKQSTRADWKNLQLIVEELAVLLPIPHAYMDDSQFPIWDSVRPLIVEAIGMALDLAVLFGTGAPATWGDSVVEGAVAAGNTEAMGTGDDLAVDVAQLGVELAEQGYGVNGFASKPGFTWQMAQLRSTDGMPIFNPNLQGGLGATLYGYPFNEVANGAWDSAAATLIAGDWTKLILGVRRDITFTQHEDGIINDDDGAVVFNAMQQDSTIFRAVFRAAAAVARPVTRLEATEANRWPFAVLEGTGS